MKAPRETILVADDDAAVRMVVAAALRSAGYVVLEAATCDEAMRHVEAVPDLLIADLVMPPDGGLELADRLRSRIPGLAVLHISGYAARTEFNGDASAALLSKPFSIVELRAHVEWLLAARSKTPTV